VISCSSLNFALAEFEVGIADFYTNDLLDSTRMTAGSDADQGT